MYAMNGKLFAQPGKRDALAGILLRAAEMVSTMPGCHAYIVMADEKDISAIWVFEMWNDKESHDASLKDERVRALIAEAMPIMGAAPEGSELKILGGYGVSG